MNARVGVITFPGTLDDVDAARAVRLAGAAAITVFLLVGAVIFQELFHPFAERRFGRKEFLGDRAAKLAANCLEMFDLAKLRRIRHEFLQFDFESWRSVVSVFEHE